MTEWAALLIALHAAAFYRALWLLCWCAETHLGRGILWGIAAVMPVLALFVEAFDAP